MNNLEKKFYQLKELTSIVNLSYRQLLERMKSIIDKYRDRKELLYKKSNKWYIHFSIIKEFKRIRKPIDYKWFITITPKNQVELKYWKYVIFEMDKQLKRIESTSRIKYVVESTKSGIRHLHFITSFTNNKKIKSLINQNDLINFSAEMNTKIQSVYEVSGLHSYFKKQNKPVLLR